MTVLLMVGPSHPSLPLPRQICFETFPGPGLARNAPSQPAAQPPLQPALRKQNEW